MAYTVEKFVRVYNDQTGEYIQIGPDSDGLDLVEISQHDKQGKKNASMILTQEMAAIIGAELVGKYEE